MLHIKLPFAAFFSINLLSSAAFAQEQAPVSFYTPTLNTIKTGSSDIGAAYKISFTPTEQIGSCYTDFKIEDNKAQVFYYDCNVSQLSGKFGNPGSVISNNTETLKGHFFSLRNKNNSQASALVNNGSISFVYADFFQNNAQAPNAVTTFLNNGNIKSFNGDFVKNYVNDVYGYNQIIDTDIAVALTNTANGKISQLNANFVSNSLSSKNKGRNCVVLNQGHISNINGIFSGLLMISQAKQNSVFINDGTVVSLKAKFSSNSIMENIPQTETLKKISVLTNNGNINLMEADFVANSCRTRDTIGGGCAVTVAPQAKIYTIRNSNFIGNLSSSWNQPSFGGALRIQGKIEGEIVNSSFFGNQAISLDDAEAYGGAIYSETPLSFSVFGNYKSVFSGNTAVSGGKEKYNALYLKETFAVFTLNDNGSYLFNDGIDGEHYQLYLRGNQSGIFDFNNEIAHAEQIQAQKAIIRFGKSKVSKGKFSEVSGLALTDSRLLLNNKYYDSVELNSLNSRNSEIDIDVNSDDMKADLITVRNYLDGTPVKINIHLDQNKDIRGQQPILFATTGSFKANRNSFIVNKVFGSDKMFDILYREEEGGLKKSWFLMMNEHKNPEFGTVSQEKEEQTIKPVPVPEQKEKELPPLPECYDSIGCKFFKALGLATSSIYVVNDKMHKLSDFWFEGVEKGLIKLSGLIRKAIFYFAPEQKTTEKSPADNMQS